MKPCPAAQNQVTGIVSQRLFLLDPSVDNFYELHVESLSKGGR